MMCDECGKNPAIFSVTIASGGELTKRQLCGDCMKKMEASLSQGNIHDFLSSILSMLSTADAASNQPVCSHCGLRYADFERTGRLGCADCYREFQKELSPMLQRIHGCTQHVGRTPSAYSENAETDGDAPVHQPTEQELKAARIEELRQKMDEAVAIENFEDAAQYRDEIRALTQNEEAEEAQ